MGMAQQTKKPVVLVCTSGSAAYNFAPAVAEAFFQQIPLIVITADRPAEWIDQYDGQTIHQKNLFGTHVLKYFELPQDYSHADARWHANRIINDAFLIALGSVKGPVHINAPFREPLYPSHSESKISESFKFTSAVTPGKVTLDEAALNDLVDALQSFKKILVVSGQGFCDTPFAEDLAAFLKQAQWPITGDILSNLHRIPDFCSHADSFLGRLSDSTEETLAPDLVITFGKSLIAKNLKLFLRKRKPAHWHIGTEPAADTFQSLSKHIQVPVKFFFSNLEPELNKLRPHPEFNEAWKRHEDLTRVALKKFFSKQTHGEFAVVERVMRALPSACNLHLANSMSVRYANHIGLTSDQGGVVVYSNRGTSGIDGCTSTAVGHALTSTRLNILITGDLAFFYDRNAFWHNFALPNLIVVVLNNHGGIIFNLIDGPSSQPEAEEFFITRQRLTAKSLAAEFGFNYEDATKADFFKSFTPKSNASILESDSSQALNKQIFDEFRKHLKKTYEA